MDTDGDFLPFQIFCRNYSLQTHFLQYEGFVESIKSYIVTVENESKEKISGPVCSVNCSLILKKKKQEGCRYIYDKFILNNVTPTSLAKWQTDLDINIGSTWKRLFFYLSKYRRILLSDGSKRESNKLSTL